MLLVSPSLTSDESVAEVRVCFQRTYEQVITLRAVTTDDFMTADWFDFPASVLRQMSSRICNEVPGINRVTYDITSKPPATVEWL